MSDKPPIDANAQIVIDTRPDPDYWTALGEFVEAFASTEICLFLFLTRISHLDQNVARALFGAERARDYVIRIKHVWEVQPPDESVREELKSVLDHFSQINETRNIIIHYPSFPRILKDLRTTSEGDQRVTSSGDRRTTSGDNRRVSSDIVRAIDPDNPRRERTVSAEIIRDMSADLLKITQHLMSLYVNPAKPFSQRADWSELQRPWRYTPEPERPKKPQPPSKKDRKRDRKHLRQPPPFP